MRVDGVLVIDKPEGLTSMEVVREIKRRWRVKKAGHVGTLDPFATGVLPIVLNEATKLVPFMEEEPKEYEGILKLGEETTTDDFTGEVVSKKPWNPITAETVQRTFDRYLGPIRQVPPMYSAIKVQGRPLYRLARKGMEVDRPPREVTLHALQVVGMSLPEVSFTVSCSKGTYIRALARDVGRELGCGGHLLRLRRLRSGPFSVEQAVELTTLRTLARNGDLRPWLIRLEESLSPLPALRGSRAVVQKVRFGREILVRDLELPMFLPWKKGQKLRLLSDEGLVAILRSEVDGGDVHCLNPDTVLLHPLRVFHTRPAGALLADPGRSGQGGESEPELRC